MLKIRRPLGRLIFNMGIAIPGKTVFLIETAPWVICVSAYIYIYIYICTFQNALSLVFRKTIFNLHQCKFLPHKNGMWRILQNTCHSSVLFYMALYWNNNNNNTSEYFVVSIWRVLTDELICRQILSILYETFVVIQSCNLHNIIFTVYCFVTHSCQNLGRFQGMTALCSINLNRLSPYLE